MQESQTLFPPKAFNPFLVLAALFGVIVIVFGVEMIGILYAFLRGMTAQPALMSWLTGPAGVKLQSLAEAIAVAYLLPLLPVLAHVPLSALGFRALALRDAGYVAAGVIGMFVVTVGLATLLQSALHAKVSETAVKMFLNMKSPLEKAEFALLAGVVAAIFEELVFRLYIFNAIRKWAGFWTGAVVSGLLFGLAHWQPGSAAQTVVLVVPLALGGMVLAAVYAKSRNAYVPILTHGLFNVLQLVALLVAPQLAK